MFNIWHERLDVYLGICVCVCAVNVGLSLTFILFAKLTAI